MTPRKHGLKRLPAGRHKPDCSTSPGRRGTLEALWKILIVIGVVAVVWGATAFMVPEEPRLPSRFAERSRVNDGERAILALGAGLVTAGLLMARRNRE